MAALHIDGLNGASVWAPGPQESHHELDLTWYGIHGVEMLYTILGPGCEQVWRTSTADQDLITGRWKDGEDRRSSSYPAVLVLWSHGLFSERGSHQR